MAQVQNTFNGGTSGATITAANSGGTSGTAFDFIEILAGATATYQTSAAAHGARGAKITGNGAHAFLQHNMADTTTLTARFYVRFPSTPTASCQLYTPRNDATYIGGVNISNALKFQVTNTAGTPLFTSATLSAATWYRVEIAHQIGTATTGAVWFKYFAGDSTTAVETFTSTTADLGIDPISMYRIGKINNSGDTPMDLDSITFDPASTAYLGPHAVINSPPVANPGTGVIDQEPGTTLTLNGSGSTDPDGTIVTYLWEQTAGTPVALTGTGSNRTFTTPYTLAGGQLDFRLTVTDNSGATASGTVSYSVMPATERAAVGGVWVPAALRTLETVGGFGAQAFGTSPFGG